MLTNKSPSCWEKYSACRVYFIHAKLGEKYDQNSKKRRFNQGFRY